MPGLISKGIYASDEDVIKRYVKLKESSNHAADFKKNRYKTVKS